MKIQTMENLILPITSPAETAGAPPSREPSQPDGDFAAVLADSSRVGRGTGDPGEEAPAENPASSDMGYLLAGFLGFASPGGPVKTDINMSLPDFDAASPGNPSPGSPPLDATGSSWMPAGPAGYPLPPGFKISDPGETPFLNSGEKYAGQIISNNQDGGTNSSAFSVSTALKGNEITTAPEVVEENLLSVKDSKWAETRPNLPQGEVISAGRMEPPTDVDPGANQDSSTDPAVQSRKSVIPPVHEGEGPIENERMAKLSRVPSPAASDEIPRNPRSTPIDTGPAHNQKAAGDSPPWVETREPRLTPGPSGMEGNSLPESPDPAPVSVPGASQGAAAQWGGKGRENTQWQGGEPAPEAKKDIQSRVDAYGASFGVKEARTDWIEKGEVKETGSPVPTKTEAPGVSQQVGQRLIWSIRNNEEIVRMRLEPPELGRIVLEINRSKENVNTTLWTDNPQTKAVLESGHLEIQRIVESEGFKLEKFNVLVQQDMRGFHEGRENSMNPRPWRGASSQGAQAPDFRPADPLPSIPGAPRSASTYLDLLV
jgi:hypothetical protein